LSGGYIGKLPSMAVSAGDRTGFGACGGGLLVAPDAVVVIEIDDLVVAVADQARVGGIRRPFAAVVQTLVFEGQAAVGVGGMAEAAILLALLHDLGV
jgi:hypothetical protein